MAAGRHLVSLLRTWPLAHNLICLVTFQCNDLFKNLLKSAKSGIKNFEINQKFIKNWLDGQDLEEEASQTSGQASSPSLQQPQGQVKASKMNWQDVSDGLAVLAAKAAESALLHLSQNTGPGTSMQNYDRHREHNNSGARNKSSGKYSSKDNVAQFVSSLLEQKGSGPRGSPAQLPGPPSAALANRNDDAHANGIKRDTAAESTASSAADAEAGHTSDEELDGQFDHRPQHGPGNYGHAHAGASAASKGTARMPDRTEPLTLAARPSRQRGEAAAWQGLLPEGTQVATAEILVQQLLQLEMQDLKAKCREHGLPMHGSRHDLIHRIISFLAAS